MAGEEFKLMHSWYYRRTVDNASVRQNKASEMGTISAISRTNYYLLHDAAQNDALECVVTLLESGYTGINDSSFNGVPLFFTRHREL